VVQMGADVEIRATAALVDLDKAMASKRKLGGIHALEEFGGAELTGLCQGVASDVVILDKFCLQGLGEVDEGGAGVCKFGMTTGALGWELNGAEEGEAGSPEVVAGIGVEELVALWRGQLCQVRCAWFAEEIVLGFVLRTRLE